MKRMLLWIALFACVAAAAFVCVPQPSSTAQSFKTWQLNFDNKIRVPKGEEFRQVELQADRITKKFASVDLPDGTNQNFWFSPNGILSEAKTFSKPVDGTRVLIRHALFDATGADYLSDVEYSLQGEVLRRTTMVTPELSHRWTYHPGTDGLLKKFESFDRNLSKTTKWSKILSDEFGADMALVETFRRIKDGFERIKYGPDRRVTARHVHQQRMYKEFWYYPDGVKSRVFVEQNSDGTTIKLFDADGKMEEEHQVFGAIGTSPWYSVLGKETSPTHLEQRWMPATADKSAMLFHTTAYVNGAAIFKAEFDEKTGKLKQVTQYLDGNGFKGADYIFHVREDGFLAKRVHRDPRGTVIGEIVYAPTDKVALPVVLDPAWLKIHQFDYLPPQVVDNAPSER